MGGQEAGRLGRRRCRRHARDRRLGAYLESRRQLEDEGGFSKVELEELIFAYNERQGLGDSDGLSLHKKKKLLRISHVLTRRFFGAVVEQSIEHIARLVGDAPRRPDVIVLAGGFAESPFLKRAFRAAFESAETAVVLPRRPSKVVALGAALFALQPSIIKERVVRSSWGYLAAEEFNVEVHDKRHVVEIDGCSRVNVLMPLVQKGERIAFDHTVTKSRLRPVREDQVVIDFELYHVDRLIADPVKEPKAPRTVVVDALRKHAGDRCDQVLRSARSALLTVEIGDLDAPRVMRSVELQVLFGATAVSVSGSASATGATRKTSLSYK